MTDTIAGVALIAAGLLAMIGATLNWRIVMGPHKLLNLLLGQSVARVVYIVLGLLLILLGIGQLVGMNWLG